MNHEELCERLSAYLEADLEASELQVLSGRVGQIERELSRPGGGVPEGEHAVERLVTGRSRCRHPTRARRVLSRPTRACAALGRCSTGGWALRAPGGATSSRRRAPTVRAACIGRLSPGFRGV